MRVYRPGQGMQAQARRTPREAVHLPSRWPARRPAGTLRYNKGAQRLEIMGNEQRIAGWKLRR